MSTAAERAAEVIRRRFQVRAATADYAIDALMADPDLLVDLAIEAGGLEPGEPWAEYENPLWWADGSTVKVDIDMSRDEFYRRASRPTGEDRPKENDDA